MRRVEWGSKMKVRREFDESLSLVSIPPVCIENIQGSFFIRITQKLKKKESCDTDDWSSEMCSHISLMKIERIFFLYFLTV